MTSDMPGGASALYDALSTGTKQCCHMCDERHDLYTVTRESKDGPEEVEACERHVLSCCSCDRILLDYTKACPHCGETEPIA